MSLDRAKGEVSNTLSKVVLKWSEGFFNGCDKECRRMTQHIVVNALDNAMVP